MDISKLSIRYQVKKITESDLDELYELALSNPLYYEHMHESPLKESLKNDLSALPPHKTLKDKYFVGFYDENTLIAALDLILCYPNEQTAFIGWFITHKKVQGQGIGTKLILDIEQYLTALGFQSIRLGYVKTNPQSEHFWVKQGFQPTGVVTHTDQYEIVVLQKNIGRKDMLERKDLLRFNWSRILEREHKAAVLETEDGQVAVGLIQLIKVKEPLYKSFNGRTICLADDGYSWLIVIPEKKNTALTVMMDKTGHIIEYYFDITDANYLDNQNSWFYDLYLDVAILDDGSLHVLDEDELDEAYWKGKITHKQYKTALDTKDKLIKWIEKKHKELEPFVRKCIAELK